MLQSLKIFEQGDVSFDSQYKMLKQIMQWSAGTLWSLLQLKSEPVGLNDIKSYYITWYHAQEYNCTSAILRKAEAIDNVEINRPNLVSHQNINNSTIYCWCKWNNPSEMPFSSNLSHLNNLWLQYTGNRACKSIRVS